MPGLLTMPIPCCAAFLLGAFSLAAGLATDAAERRRLARHAEIDAERLDGRPCAAEPHRLSYSSAIIGFSC
ncbi:MAG: hypothetical protein U1E62_03300 [Alsobacter sp.]